MSLWPTMAKPLKQTIKAWASAVGYDIRPRVALGRGIGVTLEHVCNLGFRPGTVIDVGVAAGTPELYRQFPQARYHLIEPLTEWEPALRAISQQYDAEYTLAAAGSQPGTTTIHVQRNLSHSSPLRDVDATSDAESRQVPVVTVDLLCRERALPPPYLIKIDVQGGELAVLEGSRASLDRTDLVIVEVSLFQFYAGGPQFFDIVAWMKERGFVAYDLGGGHCRPFDGALAQIDMTFVKENGRFRIYHGYGV